ncbi:MAG: hypothetical protein H6709_12930 [Kofleriaceae bacterium]|nr:hypothetical protein [Myxococcales bacterium]MCB9572982.1 hypothetical protein [Kofleriaceae bacterium]
MTFRAYGELHAGFYAYGLDQNRAGGSRRDRRVELDTTRLALEVEARFADDLEVEFEIEFEHGGTGAAYELEYEEFGEFEQEVERGGEAIVEELYLRKVLGGRFAVSVGRFYVAVGQLSRYYRPTAYLAATRAEAETTVIPQVWDELGAQLEAFLGRVKVTAQVVNGLDSTGFSSQFWVSRGHQGRFESIRASDPAGVLRVDVQPRAGVEVGAAGYVGGTSRNRPKADLVPTCADGDDDVVAPCGYVAAPVVIADVHAALQLGPVRAQGTALYGWLGNANAVSARNDRLSNDLQVLRSPVSDQALAIWGEAGWDVAPALGLAAAHRLEPFVRLEHYDTMFRPRAELFDNPRFARTVATAGLSYQAHGGVFAKVDASHRRFGSSELRPENALHVATGFVF